MDHVRNAHRNGTRNDHRNERRMYIRNDHRKNRWIDRWNNRRNDLHTWVEQGPDFRLANGLLVAQEVHELSLARFYHGVVGPVMALRSATDDAP